MRRTPRISTLALALACKSTTPNTAITEPRSPAPSTLPSAAVERELPPAIPGTQVRLVPPDGFEPATTFQGYQHVPTHASVMVTDLPGGLETILPAFTDEDRLRTEGIRVIEASDLEHAALPGRLLHVEQQAQSMVVEKWIWVFGDADACVIVMGTCMKDHCPEQLAMLRAAVTSAVWDRTTPTDPLDGLGFRLGDTGGLRFAKRLANLVVYTDSGEVELNPEHGVSFMIGPAMGSGPISDRKGFAERRAGQLPLDDLQFETIEPTSIDGLHGYTLVGTFERKGFDHFVYVVIVFEESNYWIGSGSAPATQRSKYLPVFQEMAASLRRGDAP
jgi:hypothetical protein